MLRTASVALALAALLAGCATPPPSTPPVILPGFDGARPPDAGQARLYVFRPRSEDQELQHEQPMLRIGEAEITVMPEASFAELQLPPGRHILSLAPTDGGSDLWRTSMTLNFQRDSVTYIAFWMAAGFERAASSNSSSDTVLLVLPVGGADDTPAHVRIERAHASAAEPIMRQCCVRVFPPVAAPAPTILTAPSGPALRLLQPPN